MLWSFSLKWIHTSLHPMGGALKTASQQMFRLKTSFSSVFTETTRMSLLHLWCSEAVYEAHEEMSQQAYHSLEADIMIIPLVTHLQQLKLNRHKSHLLLVLS